MNLARRLIAAYRHNFHDHRRERLFLASLAFFVTFGITRLITYGGRVEWLPMLQIHYRDTHVHHLVPGILLLLGVGYGWILLAGADGKGTPRSVGRWFSLVYGVGAALTLDEFALWLNLEDVYWEKEGRGLAARSGQAGHRPAFPGNSRLRSRRNPAPLQRPCATDHFFSAIEEAVL